MTELPTGWANVSVRDVVDDYDTIDPQKMPDRHFAYVDIGAIDNSVQRITAPKEFFGKDAPSRARRVIRADDVLFSTVRTYLKNVASVPPALDGQLTSTGICVLRANAATDPAYLFRWACSTDFINEISQAQDGTMYPAVRDEDVLAGPISLPPLPEQRRIVHKLDTLSARSTTARTHLTAIEKLVERYKLAVLGQLFGKSGTDPKPAEHLWAIPSAWSWKKVKDIGEVGLGRQRSPVNHNGPFMRPYIRSANITWKGVDLSDVKEMNFDDADFERFQLMPGDVLLNEGSGSAKEVGKPAIWRGEITDCCFQNTVLRVQPQACTSEFLYWYFLLTALSEGFVGDTKGVNIQHIGKNGLVNFPIPVPPLDEQREIVRRIETAFAKIGLLAAEAAKALRLLGHFDQQILTKAFAGDLVPQNPNDEPASVLLERIREARANAPKKSRQRGTEVYAMKEDPKDRLLADSASWPENGLPFEDVAKRVMMPHDNLRDALFELLGGTKPHLEQVFDKTEERMRLKRVAQ